MGASVLAVDDDDDLLELISVTLTEAGYKVSQAHDGRQALASYHERPPDLMIVDISLGDMDGLEVCRRIRAVGDVPIVFLTSRADEVDQLIGFAAGGDDYVTKPFSPRVLVARVGSVLRRTNGAPRDQSVSEVGALRLDSAARACEYDGQEIELTRTEFDILACLMQNPNRVVTRDVLIETVWGPWPGDQHLIESHISRLRKKVGIAGGPDVIKAVRGVGYKMGPVQ